MGSRRLHVVVPSVDGRSVLASSGVLPVVDVAGSDDEPTAAAAARWLPTIGLAPHLVDCVVDQTDSEILGDRPREALVEAAAPSPEWPPPAGCVWTPWSDVTAEVAAGLAEACDVRLAEGRGDRPVPAERPAWARPGWFESARAWIEASMAVAGLPAPDRIVQIRHWGISTILRVDAGDRTWWFKAMFPLFGREPAVTEVIAGLVGTVTVRVVAADHERGWLLLHDLGPTGSVDPDIDAAAIDTMVRLQRTLGEHRDELIAAGCGHRPLDGLLAELTAWLGHPVIRSFVGDRDVPARLADVVDRALAWPLPETFVHGDFHPGNVARRDGSSDIVIFDWSDACFSIPVVEALTWMWWFDDDPERCDRIWASFTSAWQRELGVDPATVDRSDAAVVAAAFHVVSYARIVDALEPHRRVEHAGGLTHFLGVLDRSVG